jgi:hypothetical protein
MAMAMVTMWAMMMVTRLVGDKEGKDEGARAMMMAMRVAGKEEGKRGKATRVAGEPTAT